MKCKIVFNAKLSFGELTPKRLEDSLLKNKDLHHIFQYNNTDMILEAKDKYFPNTISFRELW